MSSSIEDALVEEVGIDLGSPSCVAMPGDQISTRGGGVEDMAGERDEHLKSLRVLLGEEGKKVQLGREDTLERLVTEAESVWEDYRYRVIRLASSFKRKGEEEYSDAYEALEDLDKILKTWWGTVDGDRTLVQFLVDAPTVAEVSSVCLALGISVSDDSCVEKIRRARLAAETLKADHELECERRCRTQDRIQAILLRIAGECGEGLSSDSMLSRIEGVLGPTPEF